MIIGIDIDDTISDTFEMGFAYGQKYTIEELKKSGDVDFKSVNHHHYLEALNNWSYEETCVFFRKYLEKILTEVKPITLAVETINQLKKDGHRIVLITARWKETYCDVEEVTCKWLKSNGLKYDEILFDSKDKRQSAIEKNIDLFIDDSFKSCVAVSEEGIKSFLFNTKVNGGLEDKKVTRVYSWPHIYNKIGGILNGNK